MVISKFTEASRRVLAKANQQAQRFNHEYIKPEHILLGLIDEKESIGYGIMKSCGLDMKDIRIEIHERIRSGPEMVTMGKLPNAPRSKIILQNAQEEVENFGHNYLGTEHILLGIMRERTGLAFDILYEKGLRIHEVVKYMQLKDGLGVKSEPDKLQLHDLLDEAIALSETNQLDIVASFAQIISMNR